MKQILVFIVVLSTFLLPAVSGADTLLFHESFDSLNNIQQNGAASSGSGWPDIVPGILGNAADFSGSKAITYPISQRLQLNQGTLEFWVKTPNANGLGFFDIGSLGRPNSWGVFKNSNHLIMEVKNASNRFDQAWSPAPIVYDGLWHMVTAVWKVEDSNTNFKVCWDAECKSSFDGITSNSTPNPNGSFVVGWTGYYGFSQSVIDELKVYDYVKNNQEIANTYTQDSPYDNTKPVIDLMGVNTQTLNIGETYVAQPFSAIDNKDGNITHLVVQRGTVDTTTPGAYRLSFNVNDTTGNHAIEKIRTVYVLDLSVDSESRAFDYLNEVMDQYHNSFDVYSDFLSGGNHGSPSGWMGYTGILQVDPNWRVNCFNGLSCFKNVWETTAPSWVGIRWLHPDSNWANTPNAGFDLSGAEKLTFWARGEAGGELVEFVVGGVDGAYPDSLMPAASTGSISLTNEWAHYEIPLNREGIDLSHIISPFGWTVQNDPIFYIDDVKFEIDRTDKLRFLQSFTLLDTDIEFPLANTSYVYDNALALIAYVARGATEDLQRAKILADTLVYVLENDRSYDDGRIRNGYMSGDISDPPDYKAKLPGWWDIQAQEWYEDEFNVSTHTGNVAWAMLALITYYDASNDESYLNAALKMGEWVETNTRDERGSGGYTGGVKGWETTNVNPGPPTKLMYKSTEHNIDLYPAFQRLYEITGKEVWKERADHARQFVDAMWENRSGFFWTGTGTDGASINTDNVPTDVQAWAVMAMPDDLTYRRGLDWALGHCELEKDGFKGFDFNCDVPDRELDGIWFEGTAQMALSFKFNNSSDRAQIYLDEIKKAQIGGINSNGKGIIAASHDHVSTGFDWEYFSRLHVGATAWYIFAELGYNPYWGKVGEYPDPEGNGSRSRCIGKSEVILILILFSLLVLGVLFARLSKR